MEEKKELGFFGRFMENHPVLTVVTFLLVFGEIMDYVKSRKK
jgi:hypothetical protein